jgi:peptidyl-prolyl cis-trans isomerase SurA
MACYPQGMDGYPWLRCALAAPILSAASNVCAQDSGKELAAMVNGVVITRAEVEKAFKAQEQVLRYQMRDDPMRLDKALKELRWNALDGLIDQELLLDEFHKLRGEIKPEFVDQDTETIISENFAGDRDAFIAEVQRSGMTLDRFRDMREKMIIVQVMRGRLAGAPPPQTDEEVREFYEKNIERFREGDQIKIRSLTVPKFPQDKEATPDEQRRVAEGLRSQLLGGAEFAELARAHSQDSRADDGGEWPWMDSSQVKSSIASAALSLDKGGVLDIIEEEGVLVIVKLDDKRPSKQEPRALEEVRAEIEKTLGEEKGQAALKEWLNKARRHAVIKKFES